MTITEFLEARIAEDEADAINRVVLPFTDRRGLSDYDAVRVHAECAAKRIIVGTHSAVAANRNAEGSVQWHEEKALMTSVRALAAIYGDHPDYKEEWAL